MSRSRRRTRKRRGECLKESGVPAFAEINRVKNLLVVLLVLLVLLNPLRPWLQEEELKTKHAQIEAKNAKINGANENKPWC
jgi:hypothetical protein